VEIKAVNLKEGMPRVEDALSLLEREIERAAREGVGLLKLIHGYGSTGVGGDIRIAAQRRLQEMAASGRIRGCIFGENWSVSDEHAWPLIQSHPQLKSDRDLGKRNRGITIVIL
jgi:hypothetical protein